MVGAHAFTSAATTTHKRLTGAEQWYRLLVSVFTGLCEAVSDHLGRHMQAYTQLHTATDRSRPNRQTRPSLNTQSSHGQLSSHSLVSVLSSQLHTCITACLEQHGPWRGFTLFETRNIKYAGSVDRTMSRRICRHTDEPRGRERGSLLSLTVYVLAVHRSVDCLYIDGQ